MLKISHQVHSDQILKTSNKEKILKAVRGKRCVMYRGTIVSMQTDLSSETVQVRKQWRDIFKVLRKILSA